VGPQKANHILIGFFVCRTNFSHLPPIHRNNNICRGPIKRLKMWFEPADLRCQCQGNKGRSFSLLIVAGRI
jgi:hypothetical protein